jgi:hypothetical protein
MQVPRFWRMKTQRYRLTGVRYDNGDVQLIDRPNMTVETETTVERDENVAIDVEETQQPAA